MNEQQAIEFASEHAISVSTDRVKRIKVNGCWTREFYFQVGNLTVSRRLGDDMWKAPSVSRTTTFKRGDAIEKCVLRLLEMQQDQSE